MAEPEGSVLPVPMPVVSLNETQVSDPNNLIHNCEKGFSLSIRQDRSRYVT